VVRSVSPPSRRCWARPGSFVPQAHHGALQHVTQLLTSKRQTAALIAARPQDNQTFPPSGRANPNQIKEIIMLKNIIAIAIAAAFGTAAFAQGTATSPAKPVDMAKPAAQVAAAPAPAVATPAAAAGSAATPAKTEAVAVDKTTHAKPKATKAEAAPAVTTPAPAATSGSAPAAGK